VKAPVPPDALRCTAVARWSGDGTKRCRKRAKGAGRYCTMHARFPPRPERASSVLLESLATIVLDERKEIRVEVREREGSEFVAVRLYLGDTPTRRALFVSPGQLEDLVAGLDRAASRLDEVRS
jgi:hypothetical protein